MKQNLNKFWEIFSQFDKYPQDQLINSFTYSMLMCFSNEQLTTLYFEYLDEVKIRRKVEGIIKKRIEIGNNEDFHFLIERIYEQMTEVEWVNYTRLRAFLTEIIIHFPDNYLNGFFDYFIKSEKVSDNKKAYKIVSLIWSEEIEKKLWVKFDKTFDENCLDVLIDNGNIKPLVKVFPIIWNDNFSDYVKRKLLKRVAPINFNKIKFIEESSPISHLYSLVLAEKKISHKKAVKIALKAKNIEEFRFVLWCLGKMQMFDSLVEIATKK